MDTIKPELYWVQDRCYRRNPSKNNYLVNGRDMKAPETGSWRDNNDQATKGSAYEEFQEYACDADAPDEEDDNAKYTLEKIESGFKARATTIPSSFYPLIIGAKGSTKKRLEMETNTKIIIPRINEKGDIVVRGQKAKDVLTALRRLDLMCSQARGKRDITHFAAFALNVPQVMNKYEEFKIKVLEEFGTSRGIDEAIFQESAKLHLTLVVLILLDARERDEISKLLAELAPDIKNLTGGKSHKVRLQGLEIMNDDPSEADVLYAKSILDDDTLQNVANFVASKLSASGYSKELRSEVVKLHATVMNSRWRQQSQGESDNNGSNYRNRPKRETFDARKLLEKYGDFDFGSVTISEIRIVTRHTKGDDGSYKSMAVLPFSK